MSNMHCVLVWIASHPIMTILSVLVFTWLAFVWSESKRIPRL